MKNLIAIFMLSLLPVCSFASGKAYSEKDFCYLVAMEKLKSSSEIFKYGPNSYTLRGKLRALDKAIEQHLAMLESCSKKS